ncbi:MAG TPA: universal stress protein [Gemmataceae bacterium]|jgi:nucleotide-binding universal stress UspA family protein|nr:universal stress protein [Gemmataceae bacterium]
MSTTIMVPLDGSPAAECAIPWALALAKRMNGAVRLVGVHAPPAVMFDGESMVGNIIPDISIRQKEVDYFAAVQARVHEPDVPVIADLLDGSVISSLADYAGKLGPRWAVMATHGRGAMARFLLGETATEFVRRSPCPVLLIHEGEPKPGSDVSNVLIPLDGSELAEQMLGPAAQFARAFGAPITLLIAQADCQLADPVGYLNQQADRLRADGLTVETRVVTEGHAAEAIVATATARAGTVIALATHGRGGLSKLVWGSITEAVVHRTTAPVLVFKPGQK